MRFSENFIQEVVDRTDIEELIGRYTELKRSGSNLMGRCPFHSEKTPSFSVTPAKKMFFCFGCHAGGTAITFVQRQKIWISRTRWNTWPTARGFRFPRKARLRQRIAGRHADAYRR